MSPESKLRAVQAENEERGRLLGQSKVAIERLHHELAVTRREAEHLSEEAERVEPKNPTKNPDPTTDEKRTDSSANAAQQTTTNVSRTPNTRDMQE
eukprot:gene19842-26535_t